MQEAIGRNQDSELYFRTLKCHARRSDGNAGGDGDWYQRQGAGLKYMDSYDGINRGHKNET